MKVRIQCVGCGEKFKFFVEPEMKYDFVCPHCNADQSFETPASVNGQTAEVFSEEASAEESSHQSFVPAPSPVPEPPAEAAPDVPAPKKPSIGLKAPVPPPAAVQGSGPSGPGEEFVPPPKKEVRLKKDGKDKIGTGLKWSFRLILLGIVVWIGWAVWKNFLDPGGKVAWKKDLQIKSFHLLGNENGKIRFLNGDTVMSLDAESGDVSVLATLPEHANYPLMMAECGNNRAVFVSAKQEKYLGMSPEKALAVMDFSGKKWWNRDFTGVISEVACGDEVMLVQTVEAVFKEMRNEFAVYDHIYRTKALRISDGAELWKQGPKTNENTFYGTLAGGKMMLNQSYEADAPKKKDDKKSDDDDDDAERGGTMILTVSELATGKVAWRLKTRDRIDWGPFIHGNSLIFRQKDKLTALNFNDGSKLWELAVKGEPNGGRDERIRKSDVVYFSSDNGITAVDLNAGRELWSNQYGVAPHISTISDKYIFLASTAKKVVEEDKEANKLPPAYEKLKKEEPDLFGNALGSDGPSVKYERNFICIDAATGKRLWEMQKIYGQIVADGDRIVLFWDSADTTMIGGMNRSGKTVVRQYSAGSGKKLFDRNDDAALSGPHLICGKKLVSLTHDRLSGPGASASGLVAFNLK
jgi:outer membrane protein assembly factor BamB